MLSLGSTSSLGVAGPVGLERNLDDLAGVGQLVRERVAEIIARRAPK